MSFIFGLLIGMFTTWSLEITLQRNKLLRKEFVDNHKSIFGYRVHHSTFGLLFLIIGFFSMYPPFTNALFFLGLGIGVITIHTITSKRFIFIEKLHK
ncbi:MAG: hypothetical protein AAB441_01350 [Patescibacteria group bacterium]